MKHVHAKQHGKEKGFSLIEVLVAVLVFSLGLIGLAGLLVMSTQANHAAFKRTHATFLAENMADRMRANPIGVWSDAYNFDISPATASTATSPACDSAAPCSPAEVAEHDQAQWSDMLAQYLPADSVLNATNTCARAVGSPDFSEVPNLEEKRPPYDGLCTMTITWTERSLGIGDAAAAQTFDWVFQP